VGINQTKPNHRGNQPNDEVCTYNKAPAGEAHKFAEGGCFMSRLASPFDKWLSNPNHRGLHHSLFVIAAYSLEEGWSQKEIFDMLRKACDGVEDRFVPDREIRGAIDYAYKRITGDTETGITWPPKDATFRAEILQLHSADAQKLKAQIPAPLPALAYLHKLYRKGDLLCIGRTASEFRTVPLSSMHADAFDLSSCEFINPSPMSAMAGLTADGCYSEHSKSNTGPRVYGVIEFDDGTPLEHAAILRYLATKLPLVIVVFSGNASLHGWFQTSHASDQMVEAFYREAVSLGADPMLFSPTQFTRLPMGRHGSTGRTQRVIHFNPANVYYK
jgi:hypothetical protein